MRTKHATQIVFVLASLCAGQVFAQQPTIKPGLWQIDMSLSDKAAGNPLGGYVELMKSQMASMTPEQRAQIDNMLAASGTELKGDGLRTRQCITQQNINDFDLFGKKGADSCTKKMTPIAGGMNVNMVCTQPRMKVDAVLRADSETAYRFESVATVPGPGGQEISQKSSGTGRWLGSDCAKTGTAAAGR
ncbi:hypothetical protein RCH14_000756 [Massilia sp. MP_M2]|uniref:DUF3617 domain-containing protein n=1 Tax=Massilia sp. MP_M2 TaxID=3071713 RepID=UPI00319E773D